MQPGNWYYSITHRSVCQIVNTQSLWGNTTCRIWLPHENAVVRVEAGDLRPVDAAGVDSSHHVAYVAAAGRIADALAHDVLLAPLEASVIPLPHQIRALSRALSQDRIRYLLADEVGLGKTIEAGLIMRELKVRGLVERTLIVAPKGLVTQWIAEMKTHFEEEFGFIAPNQFSHYRQILAGENIWRIFPQVICAVDSVKPMESRRGWSSKQVAEYNKERYEDLVLAGWDLIIVDEAHRLGGSTDQVARYKLGQGLAEAAPYLLLLSATPHQGKTDAFRRLMSLLDMEAFPDMASITQEKVRSYVIRTEKCKAIDAEGKPLFKPRRTQLVPIAWGEGHHTQSLLYDAVTEYVREGYNQAMQEKRSYIGFLMILMQRLVASSTRAVRFTLERRLEALASPEQRLTLLDDLSEEEWLELDGQDQVELLIRNRLQALKNEGEEIKALLALARQSELAGPDVKAEALLDWIYRLQQEEGDPELKVLLFTEFVATQEMLHEFLTERGFSVACLNGSMDMDERQRAQRDFAENARIMVSTDAGGEGLNLQFCHVVINYDIPWNPMRIEQRIGRVDRIGQSKVVRAVNFVLADSVENRVLQVLEEKLAIIYREFGIDKTSDVLDSVQAAEIFDDLYVKAIMSPGEIDAAVNDAVETITKHTKETKETSSLLGSTSDLHSREVQHFISHPLPDWVEQMTVSYLRAHGGQANRKLYGWRLTWPDGSVVPDAVFTKRQAENNPSALHLTLEEPRIRGLVMSLPRFVTGQPVPRLRLSNLPPEIAGFWSLWSISIHTEDWNQRRIMPLFLHDDGRVLMPTAKRIWDELLSTPCKSHGQAPNTVVHPAFERLWQAAVEYGSTIYRELVDKHQERLLREREKGSYSFASRRKVVERIGLATVRSYRLRQLDREEQEWREKLARKAKVNPEMTPLLIVSIEVGEHHA